MRIKCLLSVILLTVFCQNGISAENNLLKSADSLFKSQKYTEAYSMYEKMMNEGNVSSSMLLKMAFIQDASGDFAEALYYLDLYYQLSADRQAIGKIDELAQQHDLSGYGYNDIDYFIALFQKFRMHLFSILFSISLLLAAYSYTKYKRAESAIVAGIFQSFILIALLGVINFHSPVKGIIINDQTLLRSGPSAGAEPIEMLTKGHKVVIVDQSEVWTKIRWNGEEVFVRNNRLKLI